MCIWPRAPLHTYLYIDLLRRPRGPRFAVTTGGYNLIQEGIIGGGYNLKWRLLLRIVSRFTRPPATRVCYTPPSRDEHPATHTASVCLH